MQLRVVALHRRRRVVLEVGSQWTMATVLAQLLPEHRALLMAGFCALWQPIVAWLKIYFLRLLR